MKQVKKNCESRRYCIVNTVRFSLNDIVPLEALLARFNSIKIANYTAGRCSSMMCRPPRQVNGSHVEIEVVGFGVNASLDGISKGRRAAKTMILDTKEKAFAEVAGLKLQPKAHGVTWDFAEFSREREEYVDDMWEKYKKDTRGGLWQKIKLPVYAGLWYFFNVQYNIQNKKLASGIPIALFMWNSGLVKVLLPVVLVLPGGLSSVPTAWKAAWRVSATARKLWYEMLASGFYFFMCAEGSSVFRGLLKCEEMLHSNGWLNDNGELQVQAEIRGLPSFQPSPVDFSEELKVVTFRLAGDQRLYFDRRLLMGQSEYFREMLAASVWQESQTGEIDLSKDPQCTMASVTALLDYMITKNFQSRGDIDLAFMVRMLADRYQMRALLDEVDSQLETMLSRENVSWWRSASKA
eukprot:Skav212053  [mRNA]  locus=scaffold408:70175:90313:+ [translate_table: standard]